MPQDSFKGEYDRETCGRLLEMVEKKAVSRLVLKIGAQVDQLESAGGDQWGSVGISGDQWRIERSPPTILSILAIPGRSS